LLAIDEGNGNESTVRKLLMLAMGAPELPRHQYRAGKEAPMITSRGLNHINLNVSDIKRSLGFYQETAVRRLEAAAYRTSGSRLGERIDSRRACDR